MIGIEPPSILRALFKAHVGMIVKFVQSPMAIRCWVVNGLRMKYHEHWGGGLQKVKPGDLKHVKAPINWNLPVVDTLNLSH